MVLTNTFHFLLQGEIEWMETYKKSFIFLTLTESALSLDQKDFKHVKETVRTGPAAGNINSWKILSK